jgi:hypothetical protein
VELSLPGNLLPGGALLSEVGLQLPEQLSFEQWQSVGRELGRFQRASSWWIGDWWAFGEHKWGERKAIVEREEWTGPSYQTCRHAGSIAGKFEVCRRRHNLTFEHHKTVAAFHPELADELLSWCEAPLKNGAARPQTIRALREEIEQRGLRRVPDTAVADSGEGDSDEEEPSTCETEAIDQDDDRPESGGETALHFEPRPQTILEAQRVNYLEKTFLCVDKAPPEQRRQLLETERDQVMEAFEKHLTALDAS